MNRKDQLLRVWTEHANIGYVPCSYVDYNFLRHPVYIHERSEDCDGYDWFGVHWSYQPETKSPMVTHGVPHVITDVTKWREQLKMPDLDSVDWEAAGKEETADWDRENKVSVIMFLNGIFERSHHLMGFENVMIAMRRHPDHYAELLDALTEYRIRVTNIFGKYYKPDILMSNDDYGATDGMMMSPKLWRKFFRPRLEKQVKAAHDCGLVFELHSDGHLHPIIGDFVEIGVDSLNPMQRPCNDLKWCKENFGGKITFVGGYSPQTVLENPASTPEDIDRDIQEAFDILAPGGGYAAFPIVIDMAGFGPVLTRKHAQICRDYANT